ncbi:MAG: hypothetical protein JWN15_4308 [Firmicutes bacterium]|jgi:hypothetical protein|nr:hypothetical protein [Bacillota bacterium]
MGIGRSFAIVLCMSLFLSACAFPGGAGGNGITGQGQPLDRDAAIALAKRDTPLRKVSEDQVTQFLPIRRVVVGKDERRPQPNKALLRSRFATWFSPTWTGVTSQ